MDRPAFVLCLVGSVLLAGATGRAEGRGLEEEARLVDVGQAVPGVVVELRYATVNNFMKRAVYPVSARCYLRARVVQRLAEVQRALRKRGLGLKLYDCYRPRPVQKLLWDITPDERYVAHPSKGSRHNRGAAVDLTLVDAQGRELPMPTEYDAFSVKAHRSYSDLPAEQKQNRALLEDTMKAAGFLPLPTEWWHFDDPDSARYPLADLGFDELARQNAAAPAPAPAAPTP